MHRDERCSIESDEVKSLIYGGRVTYRRVASADSSDHEEKESDGVFILDGRHGIGYMMEQCQVHREPIPIKEMVDQFNATTTTTTWTPHCQCTRSVSPV